MSRSLSNEELESFIKEIKGNENIIDNNGKMEVLIIDDDQWIHRILSHYLKEWGFTPVNTYDAYDGLAYAIKNRPMLILLDIFMPEINGDVLLKMIRRIDNITNIPVIIMSANLSKLVLGETFKHGANGFISKPFTKELFYKKIRDCLIGDKSQDELEELTS